MTEIRVVRNFLTALVAFVALLGATACAPSQKKAAEAAPAKAGEKPDEPKEVRSQPLAIGAPMVKDLDPQTNLQLGIEAEEAQSWNHLRGKRLTLITNSNALDTHGVHVIERLATNFNTSLADVVILGAERSNAVSEALKAHPTLRVHELTDDAYKITPEMFEENSAIVFDAPLSGTRYGLETMVLATAQEQAALNSKDFVVLDRPPVMDATLLSGPPPQPQFFGTREGYLPIGLLTGMTAGELATMFNQRFGMQATLYVVPMKNWKRSDGNRWIHEPIWPLSGAGKANIEELQRSPLYKPGYAELKTALELTRASDWKRASLLTDNREEAALVVETQMIPSIAFLERLTGLEPKMISAGPITLAGDASTSGTEAIAISRVPGERLDPVRLSFALRVAASPDPTKYEADSGPSPYGREDIYEGFRQGLRPADLAASWVPLKPWQDFLQEREKVLLYKP